MGPIGSPETSLAINQRCVTSDKEPISYLHSDTGGVKSHTTVYFTVRIYCSNYVYGFSEAQGQRGRFCDAHAMRSSVQ